MSSRVVMNIFDLLLRLDGCLWILINDLLKYQISYMQLDFFIFLGRRDYNHDTKNNICLYNSFIFITTCIINIYLLFLKKELQDRILILLKQPGVVSDTVLSRTIKESYEALSKLSNIIIQAETEVVITASTNFNVNMVFYLFIL